MVPRRRFMPARAHGFTLIEAALSVLIVGVMFVAALHTLSANRVSQVQLAERATARQLANQMITEILPLAYQDPQLGPGQGIEVGEDLAVGRTGFDDIDDYHMLLETTMTDRQGNPINAPAGWLRLVSVIRMNAANLNIGVATETGFKRITVTILAGDRTVAKEQALRTAAR